MTDGQRALQGCPSFETLSASFDNELPPADLETVASHVESCAACTAILRDVQILKQALIATTPAPSRRTFRLTEADVDGERPVVRQLEPVPAPPAARRPSLVTIPFAPALAAIAALLLIAVIAGDLLSRDDPQDFLVFPNGTVVPVSPEDREGIVDGQWTVPNGTDIDGVAGPRIIQSDGDNRFWTWWRAAEILLIAVLAGVLTTMFLQRRSHRS